MVVLQALVRGRLVRARYRAVMETKLKEKEEKAKIIQAVWRAHRYSCLLCMSQTLITQSHVILRVRVQVKVRAVSLIQQCWRQHRWRVLQKRKMKAALVVQQSWKVYK